MRRFTLTIFAIVAAATTQAQTVADFEILTLPKADTFYENYTQPGLDVGFNDGLAHFPCVYDQTMFGKYWASGFAYSNMTDSIHGDYTNPYSAKAAAGYNASSKYIVSNQTSGMPNYINLAGIGKGGFVKGMYISNSAYAYNTIRDGDAFCKKFGGATGNDPDFFKVIIRGYKKGVMKADSVEAYLADFRSTNNADDYILKTWKWVNLMPLGKVDSLTFELASSDVGAFGMNTPAYFCIDNFGTQENTAPYPPQATVTGSTAVSKNDAGILAWATGCTVDRGWMDIADQSKGKVTLGTDKNGTGAPDNQIVSLGDSGVAVMTFDNVIVNGSGADILVFENGFANIANPEEAFLELAFVEVSSDGINYTRFPASCLIDTIQVPVAGVYTNARQLNNLAGKYIGGYGTPFDLQELAGTAGLDINNITHVRVVDAVGSIGAHGQLDKDGRKINDPYVTDIASGGFDLEAVAALHVKWPASVAKMDGGANMLVYPNPATDIITVLFKQQPQGDVLATVTDIMGKSVLQANLANNNTISLTSLAKGVYYLVVNDSNGNKWVQKISKI